MRDSTKLCMMIVGGLLMFGCQSEPAEQATEEIPADTVAAEPTISLADLAGTWEMRAVPETGDDTATEFQMEVTPDGITMMLPDRDPIVADVTTAGDSIVMDAGPYESVRREGLMTTTHSVLRLDGDRLAGTTIARYETTEADSILRLTTEGTRSP
jgi:hypothetical protein